MKKICPFLFLLISPAVFGAPIYLTLEVPLGIGDRASAAEGRLVTDVEFLSRFGVEATPLDPSDPNNSRISNTYHFSINTDKTSNTTDFYDYYYEVEYLGGSSTDIFYDSNEDWWGYDDYWGSDHRISRIRLGSNVYIDFGAPLDELSLSTFTSVSEIYGDVTDKNGTTYEAVRSLSMGSGYYLTHLSTEPYFNVPEPATALLFLTGLIGLSRRRYFQLSR